MDAQIRDLVILGTATEYSRGPTAGTPSYPVSLNSAAWDRRGLWWPTDGERGHRQL